MILKVRGDFQIAFLLSRRGRDVTCLSNRRATCSGKTEPIKLFSGNIYVNFRELSKLVMDDFTTVLY